MKNEIQNNSGTKVNDLFSPKIPGPATNDGIKMGVPQFYDPTNGNKKVEATKMDFTGLI